MWNQAAICIWKVFSKMDFFLPFKSLFVGINFSGIAEIMVNLP